MHPRKENKPLTPDERVARQEVALEQVSELLRRAIKNGGYGCLKISLFGGHIKKFVYERSVQSPEELETFEPLKLAPDE